jgi:hypothetical protein
VHQCREDGSHRVELLDDMGKPIEVVSGFLRFLSARDCSPNTLVPYAYDLRHLWRFFGERGLIWDVFAPPHAIPLLEYLRSVPSRRPRQRMVLTVAMADADGPGTKLAATTVNRILAAVSSFYEYAILYRAAGPGEPDREASRPVVATCLRASPTLHGTGQSSAADPAGGSGEGRPSPAPASG